MELFAYIIDLLAGTNDELQELINLLNNSATRYGIVISAENSKVIVNGNDTSIHANITLYTNKLEDVNKLCYLDVNLSKDGSCEIEIKIRLALAT